MAGKIAPRGTHSSLKDSKPTFKFLITLPKDLVEEIDMLYPKPRYTRSAVVTAILRQYLNVAIVEVDSE